MPSCHHKNFYAAVVFFLLCFFLSFFYFHHTLFRGLAGVFVNPGSFSNSLFIHSLVCLITHSFLQGFQPNLYQHFSYQSVGIIWCETVQITLRICYLNATAKYLTAPRHVRPLQIDFLFPIFCPHGFLLSQKIPLFRFLSITWLLKSGFFKTLVNAWLIYVASELY